MPPVRVLPGLLLLLQFWITPAWGWGVEGHRITGLVANSLLSDRTREQLRKLIGTDDLSQVATYMDDHRERLAEEIPGSSRWHYDNRPVCPHSGQSGYCRDGHCASSQIERQRQVLADRRASASQRADAVLFLVHMVGDIHQPLHMSDNGDRGGNDVQVKVPRQRKPRNLHEIWDTYLVGRATRGRPSSTYAQWLIETYGPQFAQWRKGSIDDWSRESHLLGVRIYESLPHFACGQPADGPVTLSREQLDADAAIVPAQLARAGVRIAQVLNRGLD